MFFSIYFFNELLKFDTHIIHQTLSQTFHLLSDNIFVKFKKYFFQTNIDSKRSTSFWGHPIGLCLIIVFVYLFFFSLPNRSLAENLSQMLRQHNKSKMRSHLADTVKVPNLYKYYLHLLQFCLFLDMKTTSIVFSQFNILPVNFYVRLRICLVISL